MSVKENKELVRRYLSLGASGINAMAAGKDDFHTPGFINHGPMGDVKLKEYNQSASSLASGFPDFENILEDIVAEGDKVVVRFKFTGTNTGFYQGMAPTGKKVSTETVWILKINDGKIVESWGLADRLGTMQQLGIIPTTSPKK